MAQSTAASVINRHRTQSVDQASQNSTQPSSKQTHMKSFPGRPQPMSEPKKMNEGILQVILEFN